MIKPIKKIKDVFVSEDTEPRPLTKAKRPMLSKILSIKNFVNVRDENGNFSLQELLASVVQIVVAGAVIWGAQQLGIWEALAGLLPE